jgi:8-oxo-(d)GTP phosphatase
MPDRPAAGEIRAAGAVLWRPAGRGTQVALVHRPKYDDWSLAKGKLEPGEHILLAAVREVEEETGLRVTLGLRLPPVRYEVLGQPKVVDYWAARVDRSAGEFTANHEVDRLDWVALSQAEARLSYDHDAALVAQFGAAPRPTVPVILVRHASAGSKAGWQKEDLLRPLDSHGKQQARILARLLACFGPGRVLSSPAERCLATVRPYASDIGAEVEAVPAFGPPEPGAKKKAARRGAEDAPAAAAAEAAAAEAAAGETAAADQMVVICAHRENIPLLLSVICTELGAPTPDGPPLRKGGFIVIHRAAGRLAGVEWHDPDDDRLPFLTAAGAPALA